MEQRSPVYYKYWNEEEDNFETVLKKGPCFDDSGFQQDT